MNFFYSTGLEAFHPTLTDNNWIKGQGVEFPDKEKRCLIARENKIETKFEVDAIQCER